MAVQVVNGINGPAQLQTVSPPGYARAYASTTVQVVRQGVLRPGAFAQWEALYPGTDSQYGGPLYGDPYSEVGLVFPQRTDERGLIQVWAPEPVMIEVRVSVYGYPSVKQVIQLQFTEDPGDPALDALAAHAADANDPHEAAGYITMLEATDAFLTAESADELFLTQDEADARYAQAGLSGITQDAADLRYVNLVGDTMTGVLKVAPAGAGIALAVEHPDTGAPVTLGFTRGDEPRWQIGLVQGGEVGSNSGSDFFVARYDDAGNYLDQAIHARRSDGYVSIPGAAGFQVNGPLYYGNGVSTAQRVHQEATFLVWRRNSDAAATMTLDGSGNLGTLGYLTVGNGTIYSGGGSALGLNSAGSIVLNPGSGYVHPALNAATHLGHPGIRWLNLYAYTVDVAGEVIAQGNITTTANAKVSGGRVQVGSDSGIYTLYNYDGIVANYSNAQGGWVILNNGGDIIFQGGGPIRSVKVDNNIISVYPLVHGGPSMGTSGQRWSALWTTAGSINSSHVTTKTDIDRLDPEACARAVLDTDWCRFRYLDPPPLGVTPEGRAMHQRHLEETVFAREQNGYVLGSPGHRVADLFGLADRESAAPQSDLAIVACALQRALQRIAELEQREAR